ncbi:MAG: alpha-ketoacid dehydrogenase subunit beta [Bacillota bacterium]
MNQRELLYQDAITEAIRQEMERDDTVFIMGEDIAGGGGRADQGIIDSWGGCYGATKGLIQQFGPMRVLDTPITESAYIGACVGAAAAGLRPIAELMHVDFLGVCFDQIFNQAAKFRYMSGGKVKIPLTIRTTIGAGMRGAAQHSQTLYSLFAHIPGLKVVIPSNAYDMKGLLIASIRDDDPVCVFENKTLYSSKGLAPEEPYTIPLGKARIAREGSDITIVAYSKMVNYSLEAADILAKEGISAEVIDPRTITPLDEEAILNSVAKTNRLLVVDESNPICSVASEIAAMVVEKGFDYLDAPIKRLTAPHTPVPMSPPMEDEYIPSAAKIVKNAKEMLG